MLRLSDSERISMICSAVLIQSMHVTDGWKDGWTDKQTELPKDIQGAPKNNPLGKILYICNCSRFFHQIHSQMRIQATYPANFIKITHVAQQIQPFKI